MYPEDLYLLCLVFITVKTTTVYISLTAEDPQMADPFVFTCLSMESWRTPLVLLIFSPCSNKHWNIWKITMTAYNMLIVHCAGCPLTLQCLCIYPNSKEEFENRHGKIKSWLWWNSLTTVSSGQWCYFSPCCMGTGSPSSLAKFLEFQIFLSHHFNFTWNQILPGDQDYIYTQKDRVSKSGVT